MIEIARVAGLASVQDGGRPGRMHEGVPPGGAMAPAHLAFANASAGNAVGEAALEAFGDLEIVARGPVVVATDAGLVRALAAGERATFTRPASARVHYIAVRGGVDVPLVLGGRGTLLSAGLGGHEGRALRRGDVLAVGHAPRADAAITASPEVDAPAAIAIAAGPDVDVFDEAALALLTSATFTISPSSDRTGTRLVGPPLPSRDATARASSPMVRGAFEITPDGAAIVLGPDHPTTGGYPVLACLRVLDFGRFMRLPLGSTVRFAAS